MNIGPHRIKRAFSLLETLVVLVIVAVVLTLVLPGFGRLMDTSRGTKNLSNHRTIASALLAYAWEHNGRLPWGSDLGATPVHSAWTKTLAVQGYVTDGTIFFSPKFWPRYGRGDKSGAYQVLRNPTKYLNSVIPWGYPSYGVNRYGAMPTSTDGRKPASLTKVGEEGHLAKLILVRDVYQPTYDTPSKPYAGGTWWFSNEANLPNPEDTYGGMVYASFADGHVEAFPRSTMIEMMKSGTAMPLFHNVYTR